MSGYIVIASLVLWCIIVEIRLHLAHKTFKTLLRLNALQHPKDHS